MLKDIKLKSSLLAPCGMNCGLCWAYQREKNKCAGCNSNSLDKPQYCLRCPIKYCEMHSGSKTKLCYACQDYPCKRIKHIDKRYRTKYGMSMIENLNSIKENGIRKFVETEKQKWICPNCKNIICVHKKTCIVCGKELN
jgi:hypothetical protein